MTTTIPSALNELDAEQFRCLLLDDASQKKRESSTQDVDQLRTMRDVYAMYGLSPEDRTHRRDQVKMWNKARMLLDAEIASLTANGLYDEAKRVFADKEQIRSEFQGLQEKAVREEQKKERDAFESASSLLRGRLEREDAVRIERQEKSFETRRERLRCQQKIERENAAYVKASIAVPPKERWSKRVLELRQAEAALVNLNLFDDAKNVRKMLNKTIIPEQQRKKQLNEQRTKQKDQLLHDAHRAQSKRLQEQLSDLKWRARRRSRDLRTTQRQRVKNLDFDMTHANLMAQQAKPELVAKPSHLLLKRKNYDQTSAANIGTRLEDRALGKKEESTVYVASLCAEHSFDQPLPGTRLFAEGSSS